ncbi:MAG: hypothetical protein HN459_00090 [Candidatus Marinimicrobia bacterium]|jgi:hypothetical protein|nr:hypothetical protein [Candidatus Neomarinimicrobiota bacterium]
MNISNKGKKASGFTESTINSMHWRWYLGEFDNLEVFDEGLWFAVIDINFVYNGTKYVKFKPKIPLEDGAEKWAKQSYMLEYGFVDSFFHLAKNMSSWEGDYLILKYKDN